MKHTQLRIKQLIAFVTILLIYLFTIPAKTQTFYKPFSDHIIGDDKATIVHVIPTKDGKYIAMSKDIFSTSSNNNEFTIKEFIHKIDENGFVLFSEEYSTPPDTIPYSFNPIFSIAEHNNKDFTLLQEVIYKIGNDEIKSTELIRKDSLWNDIWKINYDTLNRIPSYSRFIYSDISQRYYLQYILYELNDTSGIAIYDNSGNLLSDKKYKTPYGSYVRVQDLIDNGEYIFTVGYDRLTINNSSYIYKTNYDGDSLSFQVFKSMHFADNYMTVNKENGHFYVVSVQHVSSATSVFEFNNNGDSLNKIDLPYHPSALIYANNKFAATYGKIGEEGFFFALLNLDGTIALEKKFFFNPSYKDKINHIACTEDGGFILSGQRTYVGETFRDTDAFILKLDSLGNINRIYGNIYYDMNENCSKDNSEEGLKNRIVKAQGVNHSSYGITDTDGNYVIIPPDTGIFDISYTPLPVWENSSCSSLNQNIFFSGTDSLEANFPLNAKYDCPYMFVDISTPLLRRCFDNTYYISYTNNGTTTANNASIEITLDEHMDFVTSSIPLNSSNGNTYEFLIGNVDFNESGNFTITVNLDCDSTILGQTHCIEAHIFPDSNCIPTNPNWDGSSLELSVNCVDDSIRFSIQNIGSQNMSGSANYTVTEDDVMYAQSSFQLTTGEVLALPAIPGNGSTYNLFAPQPDFHPYPGILRVSIEGCPNFGSTGFITQFSNGNNKPYIAIDCQENRGAYDPNDKTSYPKGVSQEKFITNEDDIEYHIRFQNTGTDTAFTVRIVDTISAHLDLTTLEMGASSHPYDISIAGNGVITWTFNNILLPDSFVNEPESHGFIKFRIKQQPNNPDETLIENTANIYFDFNPPIRTNTEFNTIGIFEDFVMSIIFNTSKTTNLNAYPNPSSGETINIDLSKSYNQSSITIRDMQGKVVLRKEYKYTNIIKLKANDFNSSGLFLFEIRDKNTLIGSGKLVIK